MSSFLQKYKRQPKLFIDLPSQGKWYDDTIIQDGKIDSIPVFGMTAMDEILLKTPDALFSGEATAQVIQSCIPNILDPWRLVGYDIDFVLIAIRIATYGETLPVVVECPKCTEKSDADVNLQNLLGLFANYEIEQTFNMGELTFILHPITYRETTDFTIEAYTTERQLMQLDKLQLPQEERDKKINELYLKLEIKEKSFEASKDLDLLKKALVENPKNIQSHIDLSEANFGVGKISDCYSILIKAIKIDPEWNNQEARKKLLSFISSHNISSEEARQARRQLSAILFD